MTGPHNATVEVLTAEVRTLQVGSRQVTLSVFNQLDTVSCCERAQWFGRVRPRDASTREIHLVGRLEHTGALVRSYAVDPWFIAEFCDRHDGGRDSHRRYHGPADAAYKVARYYGFNSRWVDSWPKDIGWGTAQERWTEFANLPLIVLAGLR